MNFNAWGYTLRAAITNPDGAVTPAVIINYGHLLQATINFFVVGISVFAIFKLFSGIIERFQKKEEEEEKELLPDMEARVRNPEQEGKWCQL